MARRRIGQERLGFGCERANPASSLDEMAKLIGADSLAFVSLDGLYRALGKPARKADGPHYCDACFTGDYPIPHTDADNGKASVQLSLLAAHA